MSAKDNITTIDSGTAAKIAADKAEKGAVLKPAIGTGEFSGKRSLINIAINKDSGGQDAVFVGVQGVGFQIPRGKQWEVPRELANVLSDANELIYTRLPNGDMQRVESPRFAFSRVDIN